MVSEVTIPTAWKVIVNLGEGRGGWVSKYKVFRGKCETKVEFPDE